MRFSTKGRFAVTAMIDVALREALGPVPLSDIALRQHISLSYLEQLFAKLRRQGLVTSIRGPGGGYSIGNQIDGITVTDILCAVEDAAPSPKHAEASTVQDMTQALWDAMDAKVLDFTQSVTLKSLVQDQLARGVKIEPMAAPKRGVFERPVAMRLQAHVPNSVFALGRTARAAG